MKKIFFVIFLLSTTLKSYSQEPSNKTVIKFKNFYNSEKIDSIYYLFSPKMKAALSTQATVGLINKLKSSLGYIAEIKHYPNLTPTIEEYRLSFERPIVEISLIIKDNLIEGIQQKAVEVENDKVKNDTPDNFSVENSGKLIGTLRLPESREKVPVVLMIAGSGPTDRNMNQGNALQTNSFLMLSDSLAKYGIASIRYDKRGVGKSMNAAKDQVSFEDYINDAISFIDKLKSDKRFSKVIVMGHSEGSLIGIISALRNKPSALISLAGPAEEVITILKKQLKNNISSSDFNIASAALDSLRKGKQYNRPLPKAIEGLLNNDNQIFLMSSNKYVSTKELRKLTIPILIVGGTSDLQVEPEQAKLLSKANPAAKLKIINEMNHVLKEASKDRDANLSTYNNPKLPLHPDLTHELIKFINSL